MLDLLDIPIADHQGMWILPYFCVSFFFLHPSDIQNKHNTLTATVDPIGSNDQDLGKR